MEITAPPFFNRGPSIHVRAIFFAFLSIALLITDSHYNYLEGARQKVSALIYPLQKIVIAPILFLQKTNDFFVTQASLQQENDRLRQERLQNAANLLRGQALQAENEQLRKLLAVQKQYHYPITLAEILYTTRDPFSRKITISKGTTGGIEAGQVVIDHVGVVGQVTRADSFLSEVTLLTDKDFTVPVQVLRNGLRAVVFGLGQENQMEIRYMPTNSDIQNGDVLVTSGIDGIYLPGLPVAVVNKIERDMGSAFVRIVCTPIAKVDHYRFVLIFLSKSAH